MTSLSDIKKLKVIESTVNVVIKGDETTLEMISIGPGAMFRAKMPTTVWREFCRRQLAVPPPLPLTTVKAGGQS